MTSCRRDKLKIDRSVVCSLISCDQFVCLAFSLHSD